MSLRALVPWSIALAAPIALASGCALITSYDGFGGGTPPDGGHSGGQSDGGNDGGADGSGAAFCQTHAAGATFCADFDEGSPTAGWLNGQPIGQAGIVMDNNHAALSTSMSVSPPASLQASNGTNYCDIELNLTGVTVRTIHLELDLSPDNTEAMPVVEFDFCNASCGNTPPYTFELLLNQSGSTCIGENGTGCTPSLTQGTALPVNQWAHVSLDATLDTGIVVANIEGLPTIQGKLTPPGTLPSQLFVMAVGLPWSSRGAVHVDNVLLVAVP